VQQRQSPQPPSEQRSARELAAARRTSAARLLAGTAASALLALLATGCPEAADLANPGMYDAPAAAGTSSSTGGSGSTGSMCEVACVKKIVQDTCKLCHSGNLKSSELDLGGEGFTARLKGQPAKHLDANGACPTGDKLIDVDDPTKSWLLKKVKAQEAECGDPMPNPPLGATDQACLETYVYCVAGKPPPGGGSAGSAGSGTGGASGGTGGASTSGSGGTGGT
jgi:uncharacterized membrane protein YgcG